MYREKALDRSNVSSGSKTLKAFFVLGLILILVTGVLFTLFSDSAITQPSTNSASAELDELLDELAPFLNLSDVPEGMLEDLIKNVHANEHAVAQCVTELLSKRIKPNRAYAGRLVTNGLGSEPAPRVAFIWYTDKNHVRDGHCADLGNQLATEYDNKDVPGITEVHLMLIVGYSVEQGFFTVTVYPILTELYITQLCSWNYEMRLWPKPGPIPCPGTTL